MEYSTKIRFRVGSDGIVEFDEPSLEEHHAYLRAQFPVAEGRLVRTERPQAQVRYFDRWVRRIHNITRDGQPLGLDNLDLFPAGAKCAIMTEYEGRFNVVIDSSSNGKIDADLEGNSYGVSGSSTSATGTPAAAPDAPPNVSIPMTTNSP